MSAPSLSPAQNLLGLALGQRLNVISEVSQPKAHLTLDFRAVKLDDQDWALLAQRAVHAGQDGKLSALHVNLCEVWWRNPTLVDEIVNRLHLDTDYAGVRIYGGVVAKPSNKVVVEVGK